MSAGSAKNHGPGDVLSVLSPLAGWCAGLEDSPDPVFQGRLLGDGVSIDPTGNVVHAPFDGEVLTVAATQHAINLRALGGAEFLIHVGIDTVKLDGAGFELLVSPGQTVKAGDPLLRFDLARLARQAPSLRTPVLLLDSPAFRLEAVREPGPVAPGDELFRVVPERVAGAERDTADGDGWLAITLRTGLEHGLHARPAATFAAALKTTEAIARLRKDDGPWGDASSPVALMGLGLKRGDRVTLQVSGTGAEATLDTLALLLEPLAEDAMREFEAGAARTNGPLDISPVNAGALLQGQVASPGLALGAATRWRNATDAVPEKDGPKSAGSPQEEWAALQVAQERLAAHLNDRIETDSDAEGVVAQVARAHLGLLADSGLAHAAREAIEGGDSASAAWHKATTAAADTLASLDDPRMRERVDDLRDLAMQVSLILGGGVPGVGPRLPSGAIVIADHLLPSELLMILESEPAGLCLCEGGATSHVAILAAARGLPMVVGLGDALGTIADGEMLALDAERGTLLFDPPAAERQRFERRIREDHALSLAAQASALQPCVMTDGNVIQVLANLASVAEAREASAAGAEGCGLLRTEFLFMARSASPGVVEQSRELQAIADALGPGPLVVRTLDAGADKPIAYLEQLPEENPALGIRGLRLSLANPALLEAQFEAMLRVKRETGKEPAVDIMLPMVSGVEEVLEARACLDRVAARHPNGAIYRLGVMVETPAAALLADRLAIHVDFFSIGTNDLTQYTLCMDRLSAELASRLDVLHPAVLALINRTARAAHAAGIDVGVCGASAADLEAAPVLVGLGVNKLSMPLGRIARLKAHLRRFSLADCEALAQTALALETPGEVRRSVAGWLSARPVPGPSCDPGDTP